MATKKFCDACKTESTDISNYTIKVAFAGGPPLDICLRCNTKAVELEEAYSTEVRALRYKYYKLLGVEET